MRRFLVDTTSIENVNVVQLQAEVEEPPPNVVNEFNPNEIVRDLGLRKQIHLYAPDTSVKEQMAMMLRLVVVFSNFYYRLFPVFTPIKFSVWIMSS